MNLEIAGRSVGMDATCFIIAEAGVNHNGSIDLARKMVEAAAHAGADAVKFQTFRAAELVIADAPKAEYQARNDSAGESQLAMLRRLELSEAAHHELIECCRTQGVMFLSTPFEAASADFLEQIGLPAFKVPSGEVTNLPFLELLARKGRPLLLSTGMATLAEVADAVAAIRASGNPPLALLHCVSNYPADPAHVNLRAMRTMQEEFRVPVGYSDHTLGNEVAFAAVALGACIIEKHFTLDRALPGPDHAASLEPGELAAVVRGIRNVEAAMGDGRKIPAPSEAGTAAVARKSLVAARAIRVGEIVTCELLATRRPGTGLPPGVLKELLGLRARTDIVAGALVTREMFT
jgi:N-acetylneuraminate synthase